MKIFNRIGVKAHKVEQVEGEGFLPHNAHKPIGGSLEGVSGCGSGEAQSVSDLKFQKSMSCHNGMLRPC